MRLFSLIARMAPGDPKRIRLRDGVIEDHMPYARHVAVRYAAHQSQIDDLAQVAYLRLLKAADNFDPEYGTAFLGYATVMIIGEIKRYFRDLTWDVHVPRRTQELSVALRRTTETLTHRLGRSPTVAELAGELDASEEEVIEALGAGEAYRVASLDKPMRPDEEGTTLAATIGEPDAGYDAVVDRESLKPLLAGLKERDKRILMMRYFHGMTQGQIAVEIGVSQMQVSRILTRILRDLRTAVG